jgi:hypothetical protein
MPLKIITYPAIYKLFKNKKTVSFEFSKNIICPLGFEA